MKKEIEGTERSCRYCEHAEYLTDDANVLCAVHGVVAAGGECRKFVYDALKRVPPKRIKVQEIEFVNIDD